MSLGRMRNIRRSSSSGSDSIACAISTTFMSHSCSRRSASLPSANSALIFSRISRLILHLFLREAHAKRADFYRSNFFGRDPTALFLVCQLRGLGLSLPKKFHHFSKIFASGKPDGSTFRTPTLVYTPQPQKSSKRAKILRNRRQSPKTGKINRKMPENRRKQTFCFSKY